MLDEDEAGDAGRGGGRWVMPRTGSPRGAHLVVLAARLQQALLDGELQQVVLVLPQGVLVGAHHAVPPRHLEERRVHLARPARRCGETGAGVAGHPAARDPLLGPLPRSSPTTY